LIRQTGVGSGHAGCIPKEGELLQEPLGEISPDFKIFSNRTTNVFIEFWSAAAKRLSQNSKSTI